MVSVCAGMTTVETTTMGGMTWDTVVVAVEVVVVVVVEVAVVVPAMPLHSTGAIQTCT